MSRENERLDRLMGLLASESRGGRDLRGGVMARLARSGAIRNGAAMARRIVAVLAVVVAIGVGADLWLSGGQVADLGGIGRRGAEWLAPVAAPSDIRPASLRPRREGPSPVARAPWRKT